MKGMERDISITEIGSAGFNLDRELRFFSLKFSTLCILGVNHFFYSN
jgi:hypothetical protein